MPALPGAEEFTTTENQHLLLGAEELNNRNR
jgi:hypothetical protein